MKLHEYQAKKVLLGFNIPVPRGFAVPSLDKIPAALKEIQKLSPNGPWVAKAQVHTGGRGKAGGILLASTISELEEKVRSLFGKKLVTVQTGAEGIVVKQVYIEEAQKVSQEYYLACVMDRGRACPVLIASAQGGMDIEELAHSKPEAIYSEPWDPWMGLSPAQARMVGGKLNLNGKALESFVSVAENLAKAFLSFDASMIEINPLGLSKDDTFIAMDAKMAIDDNALFRVPSPDLPEWREGAEENPLNIRAAKAGVNYIALDGTIGCMVNGAGLAMATMDLIKFHGGEPANFLDVGGGANQQQVSESFRIILSDTKVKGILVNIFGGIMKCDVVASGIVAAAKEVGMKIPLVVRLEGTNVEEGRRILNESGLKLEAAANLTEAADKIVAATR